MSEAKTMDQVITPEYAIYQGDCIDVLRGLPDASVHYSIFSPPFVGLYKFSNFDRDMSNSDGNEFWEHFTYLINELMRLTKPGRICSVHVMNLPRTKTRDGAVGMYDFRGDVIRAFENADWIHHSEVCIFKDPVVAQQRTKSIRLLHKQITKDSTISGQGLADYIVSFRKPGENAEPVDGMFTEWHGAKPEEGESWSRVNTSAGLDISREAYDRHAAKTRAEGREPWPFDMWVSVLVWQRYASPVWMDIDQTNTLQYRNARDEKDEQHISPLQLDVIERCIDLWSNPGDVVLTPFLGIGSEVYSAVKMGRRGIGIELKPSYFQQAVKNIASLENEKVVNLFSAAGA